MTGPMLLLGGGLYQVPLLEAVRRRGIPALVLDRDENAPGLRLADESRVVDVGDIDAVVEVARERRVRAVASIVSEACVRSTAAVAATLGLPGITPDVALVATDKVRMRECFAAAGLETPRFAQVADVASARAIGLSIGYPLVVKPVDCSGSRGVSRVDEPALLGAAVHDAITQSRSGRAILEEFLEGKECTVETFTVEGHTYVHGMSLKKHVPFPHCVSIDLTYPTGLDQVTEAKIAAAACSALAAIGLDSGPGHVEVLLTSRGPVVVEAAVRGGGFGIFSRIIPAISGVDPVNAVVDLALGMRPSVAPKIQRAAVLRFFNPPYTGIVRAVSGEDPAREVPGVLTVVIDATPGSHFRGIRRDGERPGYVITVADTRADAVAAADRVEQMIAFDIDAKPE